MPGTSGISQGEIVSPDDSVLTGDFIISDSVGSYVSKRLSSAYFAVAYERQNEIYLKTFDSTGSSRIDPIAVSSDPTSAKTAPVLAQNANSLLTAWSETRTPGKGYDVYGRIFDIDKLTSVVSGEPRLPTAFVLYQNYPNPFNPTTTIAYDIAKRAHVRIDIFNVIGQKVETLVDAVKNAGSYLAVFDGGRLASGVYFCRLRARSWDFTRKIMMIK